MADNKAGDPAFYWSASVNDVLAQLQVSPDTGLSKEEAENRFKKYGPNEIPKPPGKSLLELIKEQFEDTLVLILLGAAVISFVLAIFEDNEKERVTAFVEPLVILTILAANATVGVLQESKAESAIEALKETEASECTVVRGGETIKLHPRFLVPGDIIQVAIGDSVPADARIVKLNSPVLNSNEALLTGESVSALKHADAIRKENAVNQDKRNILFSGTLVERGNATAVVVTTGATTEMGKIAEELKKKEGEEETKTPLQEKLDHFGDQLSKVITVICIVVWLINIGHFTDPVHGNIIKGAIYYLKIAISLAVAAIPEGLPAVVTTCLALGTLKMAKKNAIVRKLPSVETLGCTTVICSDKTGTLTTNKMTVQRVLSVGKADNKNVTFREYQVEGSSFSPLGAVALVDEAKNPLENPAATDAGLAEIGRCSVLCNESKLSYDAEEEKKIGGSGIKIVGAPTEAALLVLAEKLGVPEAKDNATNFADKQLPNRLSYAFKRWNQGIETRFPLEFSRDRKSMSVILNGKFLYCKGAPESVLQRCIRIRDSNGAVVPLSATAKDDIERYVRNYGEKGLRVLALATLENPRMPTQEDMADFENFVKFEKDMTFIGLVAMMDPPREDVAAAISRCRNAGIRVIMITGDNQVTAEAICRRIGILGENEPAERRSFTGAQFAAFRKEDQLKCVADAAVFSRVEPKHKKDLVQALQELNQVVAMTGDGVNDAPALKAADIGVAMGSGTAVAREASHMVLQDDSFSTIVAAVEEGRAIFANTKQFIRYLISSNIGEVVCIFLTAAIGMPEALIPVQLLWVNLVTDGLPATALGFNPADKDIMEHPPRGRNDTIVNGWMFFRYVVVGTYVGLGTVLGFIWWFMYFKGGPQITWAQLSHFHDCVRGGELFKPEVFTHHCDIFENTQSASTVSLSILVTIEMFNALNALSENQSLLVVPPWNNVWVLLACALSMTLHFVILYVPFLANIFHVAPLGLEEWGAVLYLSFPIIIIDEALKFLSRRLAEKAHVDAKRIR